MGHIYRTLLLSNYIRKKYGYECIFISRNNKPTLNLLKKNNFKFYPFKFNISKEEEKQQLKQILLIEKPDTIIADVLKNCFDSSYMLCFKWDNRIPVIAFIDAHEKTAINADIVINTSLAQRKDYYSESKNTKYYLGFDYLILPEQYINSEKRKNLNESVKKIMICMGGTDHNNLTFQVLDAIDKSLHNFECDIVISSSFFSKDEVSSRLKILSHKVNIFFDSDSLYNHFKDADMAITAGGYTHVERMCAGVPGIVINQLVHQAQLSRFIMEQGATLDLGLHNNITDERILEAFNDLIEDFALRESIMVNGNKLVDGKGLERVAQVIIRKENGNV